MNRPEIKEYLEKHLKGEFTDREIQSMIRIYLEDKDFPPGTTDKNRWEILEKDIEAINQTIPIQYVVGKAYFFDRILSVNNSTLIPRPETEELVSWVLVSYPNLPITVLDVGTGSGCISIIVKDKRPKFDIHALDISEKALEVAQQNASNSGVSINFYQMDFLHEESWNLLPGYDVIISNPPYIGKEESEKMSISSLIHEPQAAFFPVENDPLIFYKKIIDFSVTHLNGKGAVFVELNEFLHLKIKELFENANFQSVEVKQDLQGKYRMLKASK